MLQKSLFLGTLVICSPTSLCSSLSLVPMPCCQHMPHCLWGMLSRGDGGLAAQRIGKHGLDCWGGQPAAVLFCVLYRQQDWGHHTDYCDVKWKQNFPFHREAGIQLAGALCWSQIIHACILNVFFAFPKLRIASSLPRSQRSSVYETPIEKVSVGSFLSTKILPIFPHDPGCLPAAYSCCFL